MPSNQNGSTVPPIHSSANVYWKHGEKDIGSAAWDVDGLQALKNPALAISLPIQDLLN